MKQLQNNFTTPEQSKRLLELGVPADSADCCLIKCDDGYISLIGHEKDWFEFFTKPMLTLPCWSVGRLIEIYTVCCLEGVPVLTLLTSEISKDLVGTLILEVSCHECDFSKLED